MICFIVSNSEFVIQALVFSKATPLSDIEALQPVILVPLDWLSFAAFLFYWGQAERVLL